jgi:WD40 repeat protein
MFFCARFHPDDDKQNVIMGGCADKKIHQWDSDTGDLVQVRGRSLLSCGLCRGHRLHGQLIRQFLSKQVMPSALWCRSRSTT